MVRLFGMNFVFQLLLLITSFFEKKYSKVDCILHVCLHWIIFDQVLDFLLILSELSGLVADKANYGDEDNGMGSTIQHCGFDDVVANFLAM